MNHLKTLFLKDSLANPENITGKITSIIILFIVSLTASNGYSEIYPISKPIIEKHLTPITKPEFIKSKEEVIEEKTKLSFEIIPREKPKLNFLTVLNEQDHKIVKKALHSIKTGKWNTARKLSKSLQNYLPKKIIDWLYFTSPDTKTNFYDSAYFLRQNLNWPRYKKNIRNIEKSINKSIDSKTIISWFRQFPPETGYGKINLGQALIATGEQKEGEMLIIDGWINGNFERRDVTKFRKKYKNLFTNEINIQRTDRLLWNRKYGPGWRMAKLLPEKYKLMNFARVALMTFSWGVDDAISKVPKDMKNHPGLIYERIKWRRKKRKYDTATELLLKTPLELEKYNYPDKWWENRKIIAWRKLIENRADLAYRIVSEHQMESGPKYAEAEWLSGWLALSYFNKPNEALNNFLNMHANVNYPISKARASYWIGFTLEEKNNFEEAKQWYEKSSKYPTTFYGQISASKINNNTIQDMVIRPYITQEDIYRWNNNELHQAILILNEIGEEKLVKEFIIHLSKNINSIAEAYFVTQLAAKVNLNDFAVKSYKNASYRNYFALEYGFPIIPLKNIRSKYGTPEEALVFAVIRQESQFDISAGSRAGAKGLMQLMPATANLMSKNIGIPYVKADLTLDADYNIKLGSAYLAYLIDRYKGSYILAIAAYNAGESRVKRWIKRNGDPRTLEIDPVDWIERISIKETRNYVQRVLENIIVYRYLLGADSQMLNINTLLYKNFTHKNMIVQPKEKP